jgi:hypothetical protein|tara:strand:+ start:220 stop:756 length:537 start_codon:yes stop_codon:yes gene_type:complete
MAEQQIPEMEYEEFNAPIPGQSLTDDPGNAKWENPPRYADIGEVSTVLMKKIFNKKSVKNILMMLEAGVPVEGVARTIVFAGYAEGQYNPDVGVLIARIAFESVLTIGVVGKVKNLKITLKPRDEDKNDFEFEMGQLKFAKEIAEKMGKKDTKDADEGTTEEMDNMSLMSRPTTEESE